MATGLIHPIFDSVRPWIGKAEDFSLARLNLLSEGSNLRTENGKPVRFVPPSHSDPYYEVHVFETGHVQTRADNKHDLFNALAWLVFPRTKAALNARHVASAETEGSTRGPLRDLLTLVDEGGVIVACARENLATFESLVRGFQWKALYWERRAQLLADARFVLVGHSAYEKSLAPYPGITCKALFLPVSRKSLTGPLETLVGELDATAAEWVRALPEDAKPRQMPPLPVFGHPGWLAGSETPDFYADRRWFRVAPQRSGQGATKLERAA